jgi:hypothetical protein
MTPASLISDRKKRPHVADETPQLVEGEEIAIDLRDRGLAAFLAWLIPGAGHMYQRRWGKGILFFACVMGTFFSGMYFGGGKVVYASWGETAEQRRLYYFLQVGVGLPSIPAMIQAKFPPPPPTNVETPPWRRFMAPPYFPREPYRDPETGERYMDELSKWNTKYGDGFEIGTVYTVIAGLLNVLVIFDAWGGPAFAVVDERRRKGAQDKPPPEKSSGGTS